MLSRRHLRIKLLQSLYAFIQSEESDVAKGEQALMKSINAVYDLYIMLLDLIVEIKNAEEQLLVERRNKYLPSKEDLNPKRNFVDNRVIALFECSSQFQREKSDRKISWIENDDLPKKIKNLIKEKTFYKEYMELKSPSFEDDQKFVMKAFKKVIADNDLLYDYLEELNVHWGDDLYFACSFMVNTIKKADEESDSSFSLIPLYKDEKDDRDFLVTLFRRTILNNNELEKTIQSKAKNWELDRIAVMDMLLMKMAITEIKEVRSVPVKVSLNEYIELAKAYSTPKSKVFINGILDKLIFELKAQGEINKNERGLKE